MSRTPDYRISSSLLHQLDRYSYGTKVRFLATSPDGSQLAAAGTSRLEITDCPRHSFLFIPPGDFSVVSLFDIQTRSKFSDYALPASTSTLGLAWTAKSVLALLLSDGSLRMINVTPQSPPTPSNVTEAHTPANGVHTKGNLAVLHGGSLLATSAGPALKLWHLRNEGMSQIAEISFLMVLSGKPDLRFSFENSSPDASHISHLSFVSGTEHLLAFFMNEQVVCVHYALY
jgi:hypothetical protein